MAIPLFLTNHLGIVDMTGIKKQLPPVAMRSPQIKYTCHNELICEYNKNPVPASIPLSVARIRGPYLSLNLPVRMPRGPATSEFMERAADRAPLSQLNSIVIGLKNMPKV